MKYNLLRIEEIRSLMADVETQVICWGACDRAYREDFLAASPDARYYIYDDHTTVINTEPVEKVVPIFWECSIKEVFDMIGYSDDVGARRERAAIVARQLMNEKLRTIIENCQNNSQFIGWSEA